jgi:hypothetical protein
MYSQDNFVPPITIKMMECQRVSDEAKMASNEAMKRFVVSKKKKKRKKEEKNTPEERGCSPNYLRNGDLRISPGGKNHQ